MTRHCDSHTSTGRVGWSGGYGDSDEQTPYYHALKRGSGELFCFSLFGSFLFKKG